MNSDSTKINYRPGDDDTLILILISCCRFGQPGATAVCHVGHLLYFPTHKGVEKYPFRYREIKRGIPGVASGCGMGDPYTSQLGPYIALVYSKNSH